jgi:hypothetical protein
MGLNLFPVRVPIGRTIDSSGKPLDVLMTQEFARALSDLFQRVGGETGMSSTDIEALAFEALIPRPAMPEDDQPAQAAPELAVIMAELAQMRERIQVLEQQAAPGMSCNCQDTEQLLFGMVGAPTGVDWERPGKIGFKVPNTAKFTTITASGAVALSPANANVVLSPTGTGLVTISPATVGAINNVAIGAVTPKTGAFTSLSSTLDSVFNGVKIGQAATSNFYVDGLNAAVRPFGAGAAAGTYFQNSAGTASWMIITVAGLTINGGFGCNNMLPQAAVGSGAALAAYSAGANGLATAGEMQAVVNKLITIDAALKANGILS